MPALSVGTNDKRFYSPDSPDSLFMAFPPGVPAPNLKMLWDEVRKRSAAAHASGALYRIASEPFFVEDGGIEFVVRRAVDW